MAIRNEREVHWSNARAWHLAVRCFLLIFGGFAVWWGIVTIPLFSQQSSLERIARRIAAGQPFSEKVLARQLPAVENVEKASWCQPAALRSGAIIRLRMFETAAFGTDHKYTEDDLKSLRNVIRTSLACSPADPFLWLILYWVESTQNGIRPENLNYLRMSYQLGPHEGWIILKRNPVAFTIFERLPADVAAGTIEEFLGLIRSDLYQQAADILRGPAWQVRDTVLPHLGALPRRNREGFARVAAERDLGITVPGLDPPKPPRWQ